MHTTKDHIMHTVAWLFIIAASVVAILSVITLVQRDTDYKALADACTKLNGIPIEQYPSGIICLDIVVLKKP